LTILFLVAYITILTGQNLVQNPSFEIHTVCPNNINQTSSAIGWSSFSETPDYDYLDTKP
jgi:hypothetical protein